ncbi:MAG: molybdopterin-dependent oxidoreductase [Anaerolineaceae bacterium]|nr:molybdopterin-dependent oxidoreductase [Anaerolineaceae bacterium]
MKNILKNLILFSLIFFSLAGGLTSCDKDPNVDWEVKITGAVDNPQSLNFKQLSELDQIDLKDVFMSKTYGEDEYRSFTGIPIQKLLDLAGASLDMVSITVLAADGYAIEIPLADFEGGILALIDGGEWIIDKEPESGPLRLVFPKTPASSWVFQVTEIQVNK